MPRIICYFFLISDMRYSLSVLIFLPLLVISKVADDQSEGKIDQVKQDKKAVHSPKDAHIDQTKICELPYFIRLGKNI